MASLELTPRAVRLAAALAVALGAGVTGNALLQHGGQGPVPTMHDQLVTGVRASAPGAVPGEAIKTAGLPPQKAVQVDREMKRWLERLRQLETDAQGSGAASPSETMAAPVAEPPLEHAPRPAQRVDREPVTPVTQQTVRAIQRELTERGYDAGAADGNIGVLTQAAIMAYEHDQGLPLTGEPSEALLRRIVLGASLESESGASATARDGETARRLIQGVQQALAQLKYAPGRTDGAMHEETARAIREFEMDQGVVPTGRVSGRLLVRLARASGKAFLLPVR